MNSKLMKHPTEEQWMSYLYDETDPTLRGELEGHLNTCAQCRDQVAGWRGSMSMLDEDTATLVTLSRRRTSSAWQPVARWAVAASVVLALGFWAGRTTGLSRADLNQELSAARSRISTELRAQYQEDLKTLAAATVAATTKQTVETLSDVRDQFINARAEDRRELLLALDRMEIQRAEDYRNLRGGLVRLARQTGSGFEQTENQLSLLTSVVNDGTGNSPAAEIQNLK
jgi:hypothetical protein